MSDIRELARHQQKIEELCSAAIRALVGQSDLHFRGQRLHLAGRPLPPFGPHLHPSIDKDDFASFRGASDGIALRLARSDAGLHRRLTPSDPMQRMVFDLLEQLRVESLVPDALPGVRRNLTHRFECWSETFIQTGLAETEQGILLFTLAQTVRARLTAEKIPEHTSDLIETTRGMLVGHIGDELAALRRERSNQEAFAPYARALAAKIAGIIALIATHTNETTRQRYQDAHRSGFQLLLEPQGDGDGLATARSGSSRVLDEAKGGYCVFTRTYDRELHAAEAVRAALLVEYRERLDTLVAAQGINIGRLARWLKALLASPQIDGWDGAQEEGRIDGRRLAQLVASPTERRLFRTERIEPVAQCIVTFLIDCSGSMRAQIEQVAMIVDVFVRALEMAGVTSEVLGFTTNSWNGGRAKRDWLHAGQLRHPGRLNEVLHVVFKGADTPWRRARRSIAALLKPDLFKEGVDGEAVEWAVARMQQRSEPRRILLVVSDGSPMDTATNLANDAQYLEQHLRDVVQNVEATRQVQIAGLGVGLDLSPYYSLSQAINLDKPIGNQTFFEIVDLIAARKRR